MVRISFLSLVLFLAACAPLRDTQTLAMPEEYLGYWPPLTKTLADVGVDIHNGVILHMNDPESYKDENPELIREIEDYKIVDIDDTYVYLITKKYMTRQWAELSLRPDGPLLPTGKYKKPDYYYVALSQKVRTKDGYTPKTVRLIMGVRDDCQLTEEDWNAPVAIHRQYIRADRCPDPAIDVSKDSFPDLGYAYDRDSE